MRTTRGNKNLNNNREVFFSFFASLGESFSVSSSPSPSFSVFGSLLSALFFAFVFFGPFSFSFSSFFGLGRGSLNIFWQLVIKLLVRPPSFVLASASLGTAE